MSSRPTSNILYSDYAHSGCARRPAVLRSSTGAAAWVAGASGPELCALIEPFYPKPGKWPPAGRGRQARSAVARRCLCQPLNGGEGAIHCRRARQRRRPVYVAHLCGGCREGTAADFRADAGRPSAAQTSRCEARQSASGEATVLVRASLQVKADRDAKRMRDHLAEIIAGGSRPTRLLPRYRHSPGIGWREALDLGAIDPKCTSTRRANTL